jgi:hypothetical protein
LKKITFLIIASLLVLGLVLPGCGGGQQEEEEEENILKIAVCGAMTATTGLNQWDGANMAMDELNAAGGPMRLRWSKWRPKKRPKARTAVPARQISRLS